MIIVNLIHRRYQINILYIPRIRDFTRTLDGKIIFTTLDLKKAYHQIPMAPEDRERTAVITSFGLSECNVMPFGLKNAAQTLQRFMDVRLSEVWS